MNYLPEIKDGKLVLDSDDKKMLKRYSNGMIPNEKKKKFAELMNQVKARHIEKEIKQVDSSLETLNNMGHNVVTEDFSDSPFADREPLETEDENSDKD